LLKSSFWLLNIGLPKMAALTLEHGYCFAPSAEFMDRPRVPMLVLMRVPGDPPFAIGVLLISVFVAALGLAPKRRRAALLQGKPSPKAHEQPVT
jgi:nitric oxide reductase subunit B